MSKFTVLEQQTIQAIADRIYDDAGESVKTIAGDMGLPINTVKGAIGSLVKKDAVWIDMDDVNGREREVVMLAEDGLSGWYLCDELDYDEFKEKVAKLIKS